MLVIVVLCLWICVWNTGGHVETNANGGIVVIMSDGNKPATFDLAKFVSSFGERSFLAIEKRQLIVLQRSRDGDRFSFNGSLNQKTHRTGCPISDDSLVPWLVEEKPDAVICMTHNVNIPVILIRAQREGHLPFHTKIVIWLVDSDKWRPFHSVISEIQKKLEFVKWDWIRVLNGDDVQRFSQSLDDGWFSSHSTYIVSGKHSESMLSELFMMLRSGEHKRKKRNAHAYMSIDSVIKSSSNSTWSQNTTVAPAPSISSVILPLTTAGSSVAGVVTHSASSSSVSGMGTLSTGILFSPAPSSGVSGIVSFPTVALLASNSAVSEFGSSSLDAVSSPAPSLHASGMASFHVSTAAPTIPSSFGTLIGSASTGVVVSSPVNLSVSRLATSQFSTMAPSISSAFSFVVGSSSSSILSPPLATSTISAFLSSQLSGAGPSVSSSPVSVNVTSTIIVTSPAASSVVITSRSSVTPASSSMVLSSSEQQVLRSSWASSSIHSVLSTSSFIVSSRLVRSSSVMKTAVIQPTKPAILTPTTEAPMKNEIAFILYVTFGSLLGFVFLIGVIMIILRFRRDRREGSFHLKSLDYELSGFQGIPRVSNSYSNVNYYGEPMEIDATRDPREGEFEPESDVYPYGESTSKLSVKHPDKTAGKPAAETSNENQEDKFNVNTMGMPEWNLPKLSKSDVAVAETDTSIPKSSGSVGSRELLLDGKESPPTDAKHAFDNPGLADDDVAEEDSLDQK